MTEPTTFRIDKTIKMDAYAVFKQLGLKLSQAINLFLSQVVLRGGIPFDLKNKILNAETLTAFKEMEQDEKLKSYANFDELRKHISV